ncbi:hypothetical protein Tdes44962_MAKER08272 [Teratosphaeria destructans]|uniref:Uncharacterized protein n=1 Tax=Teratosphaeria destructans TaxID=418781 RepID=A0A9W7SX71_9PEZI|nr:hypothetical protein Tdes44962_MAKER08272 [Teratosphaeria destructans]
MGSNYGGHFSGNDDIDDEAPSNASGEHRPPGGANRTPSFESKMSKGGGRRRPQQSSSHEDMHDLPDRSAGNRDGGQSGSDC